VFHNMTPDALTQAMHRVAGWSGAELAEGQLVSLGLARGYTSAAYAAGFQGFVDRVMPPEQRHS
jgi:hypothetical protein